MLNKYSDSDSDSDSVYYLITFVTFILYLYIDLHSYVE